MAGVDSQRRQHGKDLSFEKLRDRLRLFGVEIIDADETNSMARQPGEKQAVEAGVTIISKFDRKPFEVATKPIRDALELRAATRLLDEKIDAVSFRVTLARKRRKSAAK